QEQRTIGGERRDRGLDQPPVADIFGRDQRAVGRLAAHDIGHDRLRRELPVGWPLALVRLLESGELLGENVLGRLAKHGGHRQYSLRTSDQAASMRSRSVMAVSARAVKFVDSRANCLRNASRSDGGVKTAMVENTIGEGMFCSAFPRTSRHAFEAS